MFTSPSPTDMAEVHDPTLTAAPVLSPALPPMYQPNHLLQSSTQQQQQQQQQMMMMMYAPYMHAQGRPGLSPQQLPNGTADAPLPPLPPARASEQGEVPEGIGSQQDEQQQQQRQQQRLPVPPPMMPMFAPWQLYPPQFTQAYPQRQQQMMMMMVPQGAQSSLPADTSPSGPFTSPVSLQPLPLPGAPSTTPPLPPPALPLPPHNTVLQDDTTTAVIGYAQGTPTIDLGLSLVVAHPKKILLHYILLFVAVLAAGLLLLGSFFMPTSRTHITFLRPTWDVLDGDSYTNTIGETVGGLLSAYAVYAPCTVFKQHGCVVLTRQNRLNWLSNVTNGMQEPFPASLTLSNISDVIEVNCSPFSVIEAEISHTPLPDGDVDDASAVPSVLSGFSVADPTAVGRSTSGVRQETRTFADQTDTEWFTSTTSEMRSLQPTTFLDPEGLSHNTTGLRIDVFSSYQESTRAAFFLTCDSDRNLEPMLNTTIILNVNVSDLLSSISNSTSSGSEVSTGAYETLPVDLLLAATVNNNKTLAFDIAHTTCAELYLACEAANTYILFAASSQLRRCVHSSSGTNSNDSSGLSTVQVCNVVSREAHVRIAKGGDLRYKVTGGLEWNFFIYSTTVSFLFGGPPLPLSMGIGTVMGIVAQALLLITLTLILTAASLIPGQRFKLQQLKSALEVDASVAMEILHRVQGTFPGAPPSQQHIQQQQQAVYMPSPYYTAPPNGMDRVPFRGDALMTPQGMMMMGLYAPGLPPVEPSPYGEAHYLSSSSSDGNNDDDGENGADCPHEDEAEDQSNGVSSFTRITAHPRKGNTGNAHADTIEAVPSSSVFATAVETSRNQPVHPSREEVESHAARRRVHHGGALPSTSSPHHATSDEDAAETKNDAAPVVGYVSPEEVALHLSLVAGGGQQHEAHHRERGGGVRDDKGEGEEEEELASLHSVTSANRDESNETLPAGGTNQEARAFHDEGSRGASQHVPRRLPPPPMPPSLAEQQRLRTQPSLMSHVVTTAGPPPTYTNTLPVSSSPTTAPLPPPQAEGANTDWMFAQTRHLVSADVLDESSSSGTWRHTTVRTIVHKLSHHLLTWLSRSSRRRSAPPEAFPRSDTDTSDEDVHQSHRPLNGNFAGAEGSPGERTIQLFVTRARNSYRRLRRRQVRLLETLHLYARLAIFVAFLFTILSACFNLKPSSVDFGTKLQRREGDTLHIGRTLLKGCVPLYVLAVLLQMAAFIMSMLIRHQKVW